jgi:uncharacterized membrane protein
MDLVLVLALWLHTVAFVIAWGYYGVLARMVLPGLARSVERPSQVAALVAIERRALPLVLVSMVLFVLTGSYLLVADPEYAGLGDVFASTWTVLMLLKHVLVIVMVGLGVAVDVFVRHAAAADSDASREKTFRRLAWSSEGAMGVGALIVLFTVAAQAAP